MITETLKRIQDLDAKAMQSCRLHLDHLTKPVDSLHAFENIAIKLAGVSGHAIPKQSDMKKTLILVTPDPAVLKSKKVNLVNIFADHVCSDIVFLPLTHSIFPDNKLTSDAIEKLICIGINFAQQQINSGARILGIGLTSANEETPSLLKSVAESFPLFGRNPQDQLINTNCHDIAVLVGLIIGACAGRSIIVLDGPETALAAYYANCMSPLIKQFFIGSHIPINSEHQLLLERMNIPTYLSLDFNTFCGMGAILGMSVINATFHILNDMKTFDEAKVAIEQDGPGSRRQSDSFY